MITKNRVQIILRPLPAACTRSISFHSFMSKITVKFSYLVIQSIHTLLMLLLLLIFLTSSFYLAMLLLLHELYIHWMHENLNIRSLICHSCFCMQDPLRWSFFNTTHFFTAKFTKKFAQKHIGYEKKVKNKSGFLLLVNVLRI